MFAPSFKEVVAVLLITGGDRGARNRIQALMMPRFCLGFFVPEENHPVDVMPYQGSFF